MYMCVLIVYIFREMCRAVVVLAGENSRADYYNIRHAILHELLTFMTTRFRQFITLDKYKFMNYNINKYEIINTLMSS